MEYTAWDLLVDAGIIGILLVIGTILRATIKPLQTMLVPASVIAGMLGLFFGPHFLNILPFSDQVESYSSILIIVVFVCLAITDDFDFRKLGGSVAGFASYGVLMYGLQVALGMAVVLCLLGPVFGAPDSMGLILFAGWAGGFGTAAAVGDVFSGAGQAGVGSLAFTSATVGLLVGIVGGIIMSKWAANRGHVKAFRGLKEIPQDVRTGVLDINDPNRPEIGKHTFSGGAVESLSFQLSVVLMVCFAAWSLNEFVLVPLLPGFSFPMFSLAFVVGIVFRTLMKWTKTTKFIDKGTLNSTSGLATDVLVVCGIASINPSFVAEHWVALILLFVFGLALCLFMGMFVAPRVMGDGWFERQLLTWGWATGAVSTGLALVRIVDPKGESGAADDFGVAFIPVAPIEISAVTFTPGLVLAGAAWAVVGIWGAIAIVGLIGALIVLKTNKRKAVGVYASKS